MTSPSLPAAAALLCLACGRGMLEPEPRSVSLLPLFEFAEVRAEAFDLPFLLARALLEQRGWQREEGPVLWMRGSDASLTIPLRSARDRELVIRARANPAIRRRLPVRVSWNGQSAGRLLLKAEEQEFRLRVPASLQVEGENELRLEASAQRAGPRRTLALSSLRTGSSPEGLDIPRLTPEGLRLPRDTSVSYYLQRLAAPPQLRLRARGTDAGPARLTASLHDGASGFDVASADLAGDEPQSLLEPLPGTSGDFFRLDLASRGGGVLVERLDLVGDAPPPPARAPLPGRPNVVLYLVDALRADFLGAYGHPAPTSPRFDAFAAEAVLFEQASAQSSWTRPSVASLLTGLGAEAHGMGGLTRLLVPEIVTLAETLNAAGYRTAALVANGVVSPALGFAQGFQSWKRLSHRHAAELVEHALGWIDATPGPFFLYLHTVEPHKPYEPRPEHREPFLFDGYRGSRNLSVLLAKGNLAPEERRFLHGAYQGEVRQADAAFGAFLDGLAARGLSERTVIGFTADHGEEFFDHGGRGHGGTLYREVLHIPLALRLPGAVRTARRDPTPVQQFDVAPTLLGLVGVAAPAEMQGRDFSPRCLGRAAGPEPARLLLSRLTYAPADKLAARMGSLKLIVNQERERGAGPRFELYDLERDPLEQRNLADERPLARRALHALAAASLAADAALRARLRAGRETPISQEQEEELRALGYIQ
jgi:arylsulfatase A-like enzyme